MPNKPSISKTVKVKTEKSKYTTKFTDLIEKLRELGLSDDRILDLYLEVLKSKKGNKITEFTRLISGEDESKMSLPELIKGYKELISACRKIGPLEFLKQYTAFIKADQYDVEIENGIVGPEFFRLTGTDDKYLIIDPHPLLVERCLAEKNKTQVSFAFLDDR